MYPRNSINRLGRQLNELAIAAPQVISHRISRLSSAGAWTQADLDEILLMGSEKVAAFLESCEAIGRRNMRLQQKSAEGLMTLIWRPWSTSLAPAWIAGEALRSLTTGIAPVHRRAVANARRLGAASA